MADSGSSLAAALARDVQGEALDEIIAAARERLRLSRIPCEESTATTTKHCSKCGGSGEVWPDELVNMVSIYSDTPEVLLDALDLYAKEAAT